MLVTAEFVSAANYGPILVKSYANFVLKGLLRFLRKLGLWSHNSKPLEYLVQNLDIVGFDYIWNLSELKFDMSLGKGLELIWFWLTFKFDVVLMQGLKMA